MKLSPRIGILRTARLPTQLCCVLLWLIVGAALEVLGRTLRSELMDAAALFVLAIMVGITWLLHHRTPQTKISGGIIQLAGQIRRTVKKLLIEIGIDLKNVPPIPMAVPPVGWIAFVLLGSVASSVLWYHDLFPGQSRHAAISVCYLGYLLALAAL